jgi:hypothetical protein
MEQFPIRYPQTEHRRYTPGSKGLNKHYKAHREQFFGQKGIIKTEFRTIHRNPSVGLYTDQRGIPTFAYKIPDGKMYKTAPQMDKIPRGGNVPRVVGSLGDVFQDVTDQGTPGPPSVLRNGGGPVFTNNIQAPFNQPPNIKGTRSINDIPMAVQPTEPTPNPIQGSQAVGASLQLAGSGSSMNVYQSTNNMNMDQPMSGSSMNLDQPVPEFDDDMKEQTEIGAKLQDALMKEKEKEVFTSPSIIIMNPTDERTSRLPGVHQETIPYADGDAQAGYVRSDETRGTQTDKTKSQEMNDLDRRMDREKRVYKRVEKSAMSNAGMALMVKRHRGSTSMDTAQGVMSTQDLVLHQNNFNPLQNADRIVPGTETFITYPGPPRLQYPQFAGETGMTITETGKRQKRYYSAADITLGKGKEMDEMGLSPVSSTEELREREDREAVLEQGRINTVIDFIKTVKTPDFKYSKDATKQFLEITKDFAAVFNKDADRVTAAGYRKNIETIMKKNASYDPKDQEFIEAGRKQLSILVNKFIQFLGRVKAQVKRKR